MQALCCFDEEAKISRCCDFARVERDMDELETAAQCSTPNQMEQWIQASSGSVRTDAM